MDTAEMDAPVETTDLASDPIHPLEGAMIAVPWWLSPLVALAMFTVTLVAFAMFAVALLAVTAMQRLGR